jgi:hypothetical protein
MFKVFRNHREDALLDDMADVLGDSGSYQPPVDPDARFRAQEPQQAASRVPALRAQHASHAPPHPPQRQQTAPPQAGGQQTPPPSAAVRLNCVRCSMLLFAPTNAPSVRCPCGQARACPLHDACIVLTGTIHAGYDATGLLPRPSRLLAPAHPVRPVWGGAAPAARRNGGELFWLQRGGALPTARRAASAGTSDWRSEQSF